MLPKTPNFIKHFWKLNENAVFRLEIKNRRRRFSSFAIDGKIRQHIGVAVLRVIKETTILI